MNIVSQDYENAENSNADVKIWIDEIRKQSEYFIPAYTDCFLSENLLRKYISHKRFSRESKRKEINKFRQRELDAQKKGNISFEIRVDNDLNYLGMGDLAYLTGENLSDQTKEASLIRDAKVYKPLRDSVAHTSLLTEDAKKLLNLTYTNIVARLNTILKNS